MKDKFITIAIRSYEHAQRLKEKLEKAGVRSAMMNAIEAAHKKANELGKK